MSASVVGASLRHHAYGSRADAEAHRRRLVASGRGVGLQVFRCPVPGPHYHLGRGRRARSRTPR
jgi:hypothetical protein